MTEQLTVIAHLVAKPNKIKATRGFLLGLVSPTRTEPGCVEYHLHQDNENPAEFTFYENRTNRGKWDTHMTLPHLEEFTRRADDLLRSNRTFD
jgi:quinol monooxygenase YgiN